jgi:hypothetical protein
MGFMGLGNYRQSDNASDFVYLLEKELAKILALQLEKESNQWNTPGYINVALAIEGMFKPPEFKYTKEDENALYDVIVECLANLRASRSHLGRGSEFFEDFNRMIGYLEQFVEE